MQKTSLTSFLGPRYWLSWLGLGVLRILAFLPMRLVALAGQLVGLLFYILGASRRRIALKNIRVCFPELSMAECRAINLKHFLYVGQSVFCSPMHFWISAERFNSRVEISGKEHYDAALATGRNIIILAPHFSALDVAGYCLAQERSLLTMYQYAKNGLVDEIVKRGRCRYGGELVERKASMRSLIRSIRKGAPFYYLPDQDAGSKGVFVPFFHEQAATYPMLGKFAQMADALVIPCRTRTKPWGSGYEVILSAPLSNYPSGDDITDTVRMNQEIEKLIRPNPEQYFWVHKRFKSRPPEEMYNGVKFYK